MYMYDNQNAANLIVNLGVKLGGELAKQTLLLTLKAMESHKQNQKGLVKLKTLLRSNESIGVININKDSLADFKKACKKSHIQFGSISNGDKVKVFYKVSQAEMVKDVLTDILEKEKANKVDRIEEMHEFKSNENENRVANIKDNEDERKAFETIENKLDFETIDDENYRFNKENVSNEEATKFKEELEAKGIKTDIVVTAVNNDNTFNVIYRVNKKDKEKAKELFEEKPMKEKNEERLNDLVNKADTERKVLNVAKKKSKAKTKGVER